MSKKKIDSEVSSKKPSLFSLPRYAAAGLVFGYQRTLSPDHGPLKALFPHGYCPFFPTCSEYTRQAILKYGVLSGTARGIVRICRCHPWTEGGVDLP